MLSNGSRIGSLNDRRMCTLYLDSNLLTRNRTFPVHHEFWRKKALNSSSTLLSIMPCSIWPFGSKRTKTYGSGWCFTQFNGRYAQFLCPAVQTRHFFQWVERNLVVNHAFKDVWVKAIRILGLEQSILLGVPHGG